MTIEQLIHFNEAAKELSFTRAADKLFVHQSSVSRSVANLEQEMNVMLFFREKKTLRLTQAGEYLHRQSEPLLGQLRQLETNVKRIGMGIIGKLKITGNTFYTRMISTAYKMFRDLHPDVEVNVFDMREEDLEIVKKQILTNEVDLGVLFLGLEPEEYGKYEVIKIYTEKLDLILPRGHRLYNKKSVSISDLAGEYAISAKYMQDTNWIEINKKLEEKGLPTVRIQPMERRAATESELLTQISAGFGIAMMPRLLGKSFLGMKTTPVTGINNEMPLSLVYSKNNRNPTLKLFIDVFYGCMFPRDE